MFLFRKESHKLLWYVLAKKARMTPIELEKKAQIVLVCVMLYELARNLSLDYVFTSSMCCVLTQIKIVVQLVRFQKIVTSSISILECGGIFNFKWLKLKICFYKGRSPPFHSTSHLNHISRFILL